MDDTYKLVVQLDMIYAESVESLINTNYPDSFLNTFRENLKNDFVEVTDASGRLHLIRSSDVRGVILEKQSEEE